MSKRKVFFGPGTVLALLIAIGVAAYAFDGQRPASNIEELRERARSSAPVAPLAKPEPANLLRLNLSLAQASRVRAIDAEWQAERSALLLAMGATSAPADDGRRSLEQLKAGLQDYSRLSRKFDLARERHWLAALDVLTPAQRKEAEVR